MNIVSRYSIALLMLTILTGSIVTPPQAMAQPAPQGELLSPVVDEQAPLPEGVNAIGGSSLERPGQVAPTAPPPSPKARIIVKEMALSEILQRLTRETGVRVTARGKIGETVMDLKANDIPLEEILTMISKPKDWVWIKRDDGSYEIMTQEEYTTGVLSEQVRRKTFNLKFIEAEQFVKVVQDIITPEIGAIAFDARTNNIIVTDLPDKLALIESIIAEYDIQLYTRVFEILHADTLEISDRLNEIKSEAAEIQVDEKNRIIIVKDTFDRIKEMEQLVALLDRDQEIRTYNLANIGIDSKLATDLISDVLEEIVTPEATIIYNEATSKLLVKDVRAVHEKILDILSQLDQPRKQVLIEGEVLQVDMSDSLNYGTELGYSHNMYEAYDTGKTVAGNDSFGGDIDLEAGVNELAKGLPMFSFGANGISVQQLNEHFRAQLSAALNNTEARLLLRPRLLVANHEEGEFNVTQSEPIAQTYYSSSNTSSETRTSGQRLVESGLTVQIIPHISNRGLIELEVLFENSQPIFRDNIDGDGTRGVGKDEKSAQTIMLMPSGSTRVIGGLIQRDQTETSSGIPYLVDLPYVGWLFGSKSHEESVSNLMFFLTATIVQEEPLNDIIVEPVNEAARVSMRTEAWLDGDEEINPIPEQLRPYLQEIRPDSLPYDEDTIEDDTPTTGTMVSDSLAAGQSLLTDEPFEVEVEKSGPAAGGAGLGSLPSNQRILGPSGGLGKAKPKPAEEAPAQPDAEAQQKPATQAEEQAPQETDEQTEEQAPQDAEDEVRPERERQAPADEAPRQ